MYGILLTGTYSSYNKGDAAMEISTAKWHIQIAYGLNRPVITTNVGGLPEVVQDGKTGFLVKPESPESLSQAIIKFYKGDYEKYFCREIKKSNNAFSWENEISSIESLLMKNK